MQLSTRNAAIWLFFIGLAVVEAQGRDMFQAFGRIRNGAVSETYHASASATAFASTANTAFALPDAASLRDLDNRGLQITSGPILYVGNTGSGFTDANVVGLQSFGDSAPNTDAATALSYQLLTDVNVGTMSTATATGVTRMISNSIATLSGTAGATTDEATAAAFTTVNESITSLQAAIDATSGNSFSSADKARVNAQITALNTALSALDANLAAAQPAAPEENEQRFADDLNGNGSNGFQQVVSLVDGEQVVIGTIIDFGDLYEFNVFFDTVVVREAQAFTSFEVMKQHVFYASPGENRLATGWRFDAYWDDWSVGFGEEVRGGWAIDPERLDSINHDWLRDPLAATSWSTYGTFGVRAMRLEEDFSFDGRGSILGRTQVATMIDHDVIGPQLGWGVVAEESMFRFEAVLLGLVGYGNAETKQAGIFGEELIPGALNRPASGRSTYSHDETNDDYFAWHGEARITGSCYLTQHLRFDATWRGILSGPVRDATTVTAWNAPSFGINNHDGDTVDLSHWYLGLTYTH